MHKRVIPLLLLENERLIKTIRFNDSTYIGDPINTIRLFNQKKVPEIVVLDKGATRKKSPNYKMIQTLASECYVPLIYGGGIKNKEQAELVFNCGVEKIVINSALFEKVQIVEDIASRYGCQSIIASIDVKETAKDKYSVFSGSGTMDRKMNPLDLAKICEQRGAGEILLQSIDRDGTYSGYGTEMITKVSSHVTIPVIACGGAGNVLDLEMALHSGASGVAAGSIFCFSGRRKAVLINFPEKYRI